MRHPVLCAARLIDGLAEKTSPVKKLNEEINDISKKLYPEFYAGIKNRIPVNASPAAKRVKATGIAIAVLGFVAGFGGGVAIGAIFGPVGAIPIIAGLVIAFYGGSVAVTKSFSIGAKMVFVPGGMLLLPVAVLQIALGHLENFEDAFFPVGIISGLILFATSLVFLTAPLRKARKFLAHNRKNFWEKFSEKEGVFIEVCNKKGDRAEISVFTDSRYTVSVEKKTGDSFEPAGEKRQFFLDLFALVYAVRELLILCAADDGRPEDGFVPRYAPIREVAEALKVFSFLEEKIFIQNDYESLRIVFHRCLTMEINEGAVLINGALFMLGWDKGMIMDIMSKLLGEEIILFEYKRKRIFFNIQALDFLLSKYRNKKCCIYSGINIYLEPGEKTG